MSDKKNNVTMELKEEVELRKEPERFREEVIGTDGKPVWVPTKTIGSQNKELSNREKLRKLGWTDEELDRTSKFAPRAPRKVMADGTLKGAYKFKNGVSYLGFGSMFDDLEQEEERARHNKTKSVSNEVASRLDMKTLAIMEKVPMTAWNAVLEGNDQVDNNTKRYLLLKKHLMELKAPKDAFELLDETFHLNK